MQGRLGIAVAGSMLAAGAGYADPWTNAGTRAAGLPDQEIVVSASRDRREAVRMAASVTVLEREAIRESGAATLVEALRTLDGVLVRSTSGNDAQSEVALRGFGENAHGRVLVLLDGHRLNNPDMAGINWAQIPLSGVERIEVLRGGQSALYGDHAVGGVINIVTRQGAGAPERYGEVQAGQYGRTVARAGAAGAAGPVRYAANAERQQADGYRDRSAYLTWGGGASLGYDLSPDYTLTLRADGNTMDYQLPGALTRAQMDADPRQSLNPADQAATDIGTVHLALNARTTEALRLDAGLYYGHKKTASDMASWLSYADVGVDSFGATPRATWQHDLAGRDHTLLVGFDGYADRLDSRRYGEPARADERVSGQVYKYTLGAYARDEVALTKTLLLGLGARHEQARIGADVRSVGAPAVDGHKTHQAQAADVSLVYAWSPGAKLFARAGTVYRFPFVDEQISYIGYGADSLYADLDMERGRTWEAGATLPILDHAQAGITAFRLEMRDEIAYNAYAMRNENMDDTSRQGVETYAAWAWPGWMQWNANYTYQEAVFTDGPSDGHDVPLVPRHKAALAARLFLPWEFALDGAGTCVGRQRLGGDYDNTGDRLDAYTRVDVALRYIPSRLAAFGLEAFVGLDNVFDRPFAETGYMGWVGDAFDGVYYPAPGRAWKAGLSGRF